MNTSSADHETLLKKKKKKKKKKKRVVSGLIVGLNIKCVNY